MWREFLLGFTSQVRFEEPASPAEIAESERALGVALPGDLRSLLEETNGVWALVRLPGMEDEEPSAFSLLWSTHEMIAENESLSETFPSLLFFASEPNGDSVAFPIVEGIADSASVVTISHDGGAGRQVRPWSLREYLTPFLEWIRECEAGK